MLATTWTESTFRRKREVKRQRGHLIPYPVESSPLYYILIFEKKHNHVRHLNEQHGRIQYFKGSIATLFLQKLHTYCTWKDKKEAAFKIQDLQQVVCREEVNIKTTREGTPKNIQFSKLLEFKCVKRLTNQSIKSILNIPEMLQMSWIKRWLMARNCRFNLLLMTGK